MPPLHLYLAFVAATTILMLIPGPNVALIVATSVRGGTRQGLLTVAGTSSAVVVHLALTVVGLAALLGTLGGWFAWVRWIGAAYLVWLGIRQWRAPAPDLGQAAVGLRPRRGRAVFLRGFLVSLTNPKTLLFYGAFFPQFVTADRYRRRPAAARGDVPRAGRADRRLVGGARRPRPLPPGAPRQAPQPGLGRAADRGGIGAGRCSPPLRISSPDEG